MKKRDMILAACVAVLLVTVGVFSGYLYGTHKLTKEYRLKDENLQRVIHAWEGIQDYHMNNEILDYEDISNHAIQGMVEALNDRYAFYYPPGRPDAIDNLGINYIGVGCSFFFNDDGSRVISDIYKVSPAAEAGMQFGDVVLCINGIDIRGASREFIASMMSGDVGTHVIFTVLRDGKTMDIDVTMGKVKMPSAIYTLDDGVGFIVISTFDEYVVDDFMDCFRKAEADHVTGIVIDLLDNIGGLTDAVTPIASCFLDEGDTLISFYDHGSVETITAQKSDLHTDVPVVVLISENTASAAEMLLCALTENGRAVSAGTTTFGKGTWNLNIGFDDAMLQFTGGTWNTPNGNNVTGKGVTPDYEVDLYDDPWGWCISYLTGTD